MSNSTVFYPQSTVTGDGAGIVSHAGLALVTRTAEVAGLPRLLSDALTPWRKDYATHDPGKIVLDLAVAMVGGADCAADLAVLRGRETVFGPVASDPTVSRLIATLADEPVAALAAIAGARAVARKTVWELAGEHAPNHRIDEHHPLVIDLDATLVTAHSEKQDAAPTYKRGFGFHPLLAFIDHGPGGTGKPPPHCCGPGMLGRTPPPTTSPSFTGPWPRSRVCVGGPAARSSSAPIVLAAPKDS